MKREHEESKPKLDLIRNSEAVVVICIWFCLFVAPCLFQADLIRTPSDKAIGQCL